MINSPTLQSHQPTTPAHRIFKRRDCLPLDEDTLWCIQAGAVRTLTFTEDGTIIPLGFWSTGDLVGRPLSQIQPYQIECLTDVKVIAIARSDYQFLDQVMLSHISQMEQLLRIRSGQVQQRFLQLLTWLAERFGHETSRGQQITLQPNPPRYGRCDGSHPSHSDTAYGNI